MSGGQRTGLLTLSWSGDLERQGVTSLDTEIFSLVEFCFLLWFKRTVKAIEEEGERGEIMRPVSKEAYLFPEGEEIWRFLEAIWVVSSQLPQGLLSFFFSAAPCSM